MLWRSLVRLGGRRPNHVLEAGLLFVEKWRLGPRL